MDEPHQREETSPATSAAAAETHAVGTLPAPLPSNAWTNKWQEKLLPMMVGTIIASFVFFLGASFRQLDQILSFAEGPYLNQSADNDTQYDSLLNSLQLEASKVELQKWHSSLLLERQATRYRYHEAAVFGVFRIWTRYTAFVTGMILVCVGSVFILGKMQENVSKVGYDTIPFKLSLDNSSPGILLAAFGVALMITTLLTQYPIDIKDQPLYITPTATGAAAQPVLPPPPPFSSGAYHQGGNGTSH